MGKYIETVPRVKLGRSTIKMELTAYGLDNMSVIGTGEVFDLTPSAALELANKLMLAVKEVEHRQSAEIKRLQA